jgi:putative ABC transport system ATP-binding protein
MTDDSVSGMGAKIAVRNLTKRFTAGGTHISAIDDVTTEFAPGSMTAITGPSGSGKSTLLHLIGGIDRADAGSITVDDQEIIAMRRAKLTTYRRRVGFVFQRYHLLPTLTALDNVIAPVLPYRIAFPKANRARELL